MTYRVDLWDERTVDNPFGRGDTPTLRFPSEMGVDSR